MGGRRVDDHGGDVLDGTEDNDHAEAAQGADVGEDGSMVHNDGGEEYTAMKMPMRMTTPECPWAVTKEEEEVVSALIWTSVTRIRLDLDVIGW